MVERPLIEGLPTRLRLIEPIGRGASGVVWRARDSERGADVAVKVLAGPAEVVGDRIEREARALARLRDVAGVLTVHDVGLSAGGAGWIVSDLAPGGSLADRLPVGGEPARELSPDEVDPDVPASGVPATPAVLSRSELLLLAVRLAATVGELHDRDVVHGDLSPANVLLGVQGEPWISDFGQADLGDGAAAASGFTPAYAAPERHRGAPASRAADVYSVAALLVRSGLDLTGGSGASALHEQPSTRPTATRLADELAYRLDHDSRERGTS